MKCATHFTCRRYTIIVWKWKSGICPFKFWCNFGWKCLEKFKNGSEKAGKLREFENFNYVSTLSLSTAAFRLWSVSTLKYSIPLYCRLSDVLNSLQGLIRSLEGEQTVAVVDNGHWGHIYYFMIAVIGYFLFIVVTVHLLASSISNTHALVHGHQYTCIRTLVSTAYLFH